MEEKKTPKKRSGTKLLWLIGILLVVVPGIFLVQIFVEDKDARDEYRQIEQQYTASAPQTEPDGPQLKQIDWEGLQAQNDDVVGWIQMDAIEILDYPIVKGEDNGFYLDHSYTGAYRPAGAIFMEHQNAAAFSDLHTIVYGHNVQDGSMFGGLVNYMQEDFYRENGGELLLYTPAGIWQYQVFSVEKTTTEDPGVYTIGFVEGDVYAEFLQNMKARSVYDTGIGVDGNDYVITLSTCVSGTSQSAERIVVHAKCMKQLA